MNDKAAPCAEPGLHLADECLQPCRRHPCLRRSGEAAAVNTVSSLFACKSYFCKAEREGETLFAYVLYGVNVLEVLEAGVAGCGNATEEAVDIAVRKSHSLGGNAIADIVVFGQIAGQNAMK